MSGVHLARQLCERHHPHRDAVSHLRAAQRNQHAGMLLVAGDDLIARGEREPREHGVDPVRGRVRERNLRGSGTHRRRVAGPRPLGQPYHLVEVRLADAAVGEIKVDTCTHGVLSRLRHGALGTGIQVRVALEHRELFAEAGRDCRF